MFEVKSVEKPVYTVSLDKLELLLNGTIKQLDVIQFSGDKFDILSLSESVLIRKNFRQTNPRFYNCFDVYIENNLFAQLYFGVNSKYRFGTANPVLLNVENHVLYADGLVTKINTFLNAIPEIKFEKFYSLDIAIDGYDLGKKHEKLSNSKEYFRKVSVKYKLSKFVDKGTEEKACIIGSNKSDKNISIYNKQSEIAESRKNYILDFWNKNNLFIQENKTIDRIEGRLNSKELVTFSKDFSDLENTSYLISFFKLKFESYLTFCNTKKPKERRHIINWSLFKTYKIQKEIKTEPAKKILLSMKITIHTIFDEYLLTGDDNSLICFLKYVAKNRLIDWALNNMDNWKRDLRY